MGYCRMSPRDGMASSAKPNHVFGAIEDTVEIRSGHRRKHLVSHWFRMHHTQPRCKCCPIISLFSLGHPGLCLGQGSGAAAAQDHPWADPHSVMSNNESRLMTRS